MALHFYAQRRSIKDGAIQPVNIRHGERADMERQYHLYCASAAINADGFELDAVELGTIERGVIERKVWTHEITPPEPEPETETEQVAEGE